MVYLLFNISSFNSIFEILSYVLSTLAVIFLTMPIHELAHGLVAHSLGDPTPKYQGRLTINPFAHIDYMGALCMLIFGVGWAKPVQVNARYFKNPKWGMAITAAAGPIANILAAIVTLLIGNSLIAFVDITVQNYEFMSFIISFIVMIAQINVYLAVFNLIPIPPFDGSRLLSAFLPDRLYYKLMRYEQYLFIVLMVLLVLSSNVGFNPINGITYKVLEGVNWIAALPFKLLG